MLAAMVLGAMLSTCSSPPSVLERILRSGELRVVTRNTPAAFYYGADEPRGIEYELARGYAAKLGVSLRIYIDDQVFPDLVSGKAQIGAASLTVADARRDSVTFGPGYQQIEPLIVYRRGTPRPRKLGDLVGAQLEVVASSSHAALLEELRAQEPLLTWIEHTQRSSEELIRRVAEGELDYTVADSHLFELLRHFYPDLRVAFPLGPTDQIAWALPKGDEPLRESIAAYFAELEATGELKQILDRYYFASSEFDYVGSRAFVRHVNTRLPRYRDFFLEAERSTGIDWRLLAAIAYQESHWDPAAVSPTGVRGMISPTGVRGMMMLTEHTANMMEVGNRQDARSSILGGAHYYLRVRRKVPERIAEPDRSWLAVAAYNLGFGHLEDARILTQMQGADPDRYDEVRARLPLLSDKAWFSRVQRGFAPGQTAVRYVDNVRRYYEILMWLDSHETLTSQEYVPPSVIGSGG
jgi:membrane-bound lytic murein transglycosylase F